MKEFALTARDRLTVVGFTLTIVVDTLMYRLLGLIGYRTAEISLIIFGLLLGFYAICQHLSLRLVKGLSRQGLSASRHAQLFRKIQIGVILMQYLLLFLLLIILLDVVITSGYSIVLLEGMLWLSYGSTCALLLILVRRLISWYRVRPDNVVLFYTVAIGFLALNIILTPLYLSRDLGNVPEEIKFLKQSGMPFSSADNYYYEPYIFTSIFSYLATWFASIMLLRHFSLKIGKAKYIFIIILPLLYFGSQFQIQFLDIFSGLRATDPVLFSVFYTIVFIAVKPVGGILFGFAFWIIARSLDDQRMKFYLNTAGIGIMLIFIANQPQGLNIAPYPPFGLIAICSLPMGAFLILGGIYTSALAIAQDNSLRQQIKSSVTLKTGLLDKIGSSELDLEIEAKVSQIQRKVILEPYKLDEPPSEELIKEYIKEVIEELNDKSERRQNDS